MENKPKIFCDKCRKFVAYFAGCGEFFYVRDTEFFYCKSCADPRPRTERYPFRPAE